jgi:hypothetical protein
LRPDAFAPLALPESRQKLITPLFKAPRHIRHVIRKFNVRLISF